jgi:hypothetical protein
VDVVVRNGKDGMPKMAVGVVEVVGDGFNGTNKGAVVEESWKPAPERLSKTTTNVEYHSNLKNDEPDA